MSNEPQELFQFGVATGTHGLRGDLKVRPLTGDAALPPEGHEVFFRRRDGSLAAHRPVRATRHKGHILLRLEGLEEIGAVQHLVGCEVLMRYADLEALPEEEFYWFELEGLTVVDRQRGELGILEEMVSTAAHDIYVVRGRFGEVLIPAVDEFVVEIDREGGRMLVDLPDGLIPENDAV
jgi:16S rRNA processing protein RimM